MANDLPGWVGSVSADALADLLALHGERDWLDYKQQCDLSSPRGVVDFTKDVGAMMMAGGYILVGADDNGKPSGDVEHLALFDPATLHDKLAKYLPKPFEIRAATHHHEGQSYALIYAVPHPDGFCIFEHDGTYHDGKGQITVFRHGEVFARHGTKSERWNQRDQAVIRQRLRADADRGRGQQSEALNLLQGIPKQLGGSGVWLAIAVLPQYPAVDPERRSPDVAQRLINDWHLAGPIEILAQGTATYRQPGGVVVTSQPAINDPPHWWLLALQDTGEAVGTHVLSYEIVRGGKEQWYGLPEITYDPQTIPARRDKVESHLLSLLDLLTAHALDAGAGGRALIMATLLAPSSHAWTNVTLVEELVDDSGQRQGWRPASARAHRPASDTLGTTVVQSAWLADMRDATIRVHTACGLAADLLAIFGIDEPKILLADGTLDPDGAAIDRQQFVYQHARQSGLPVDAISPSERRQQYEDEVRAAKERLRRR